MTEKNSTLGQKSVCQTPYITSILHKLYKTIRTRNCKRGKGGPPISKNGSFFPIPLTLHICMYVHFQPKNLIEHELSLKFL